MKPNCQAPKRSLLIYQILTLALTLLCVGVRVFDLFFFFDKEINYYKDGFLPGLEVGLLIGGLVLLLALSFLWLRPIPMDFPATPKKATRLVSLLSALCALVFLFLMTKDGGELSLIPTGTSELTVRATLVLSLLVGAYFLLAAGNLKTAPWVLLLVGILSILWFLAALASSYFDITVQMNAPDKVFFLFACFSGMFYVAEELRMLLGEPRPARYAFSAGLSVLLCGLSSIPSILAVLAGRMERPSWFLCHLMTLGLCLYAAARLWSLRIKTAEEAVAEEEPQEEPQPIEESEPTEEPDPAEESQINEEL